MPSKKLRIPQFHYKGINLFLKEQNFSRLSSFVFRLFINFAPQNPKIGGG